MVNDREVTVLNPCIHGVAQVVQSTQLVSPLQDLHRLFLHLYNQSNCRLVYKFFHSLFIASIFNRLYGVLNIGKKNN